MSEGPVRLLYVDDDETLVRLIERKLGRRGYEVVHPLTTEAWGVRRFFVRSPDGHVLNILQHHD